MVFHILYRSEIAILTVFHILIFGISSQKVTLIAYTILDSLLHTCIPVGRTCIPVGRRHCAKPNRNIFQVCLKIHTGIMWIYVFKFSLLEDNNHFHNSPMQWVYLVVAYPQFHINWNSIRTKLSCSMQEWHEDDYDGGLQFRELFSIRVIENPELLYIVCYYNECTTE